VLFRQDNQVRTDYSLGLISPEGSRGQGRHAARASVKKYLWDRGLPASGISRGASAFANTQCPSG